MSKIFEGIKVLIISKLLGFTAISAKIIKTKIEQNGGKADLMPSDSFKDVNDYTYIIAPGNITEDHVKKLLNLNDIEILTILSPEWAHSCIVSKKLQDISNFQVKFTPESLTSTPAKRKPDESEFQNPKRVSNIDAFTQRSHKHSSEWKFADPDEKSELSVIPEMSDPSRIKAGNLNKHITDELENLQKLYETLGDKGRSITYANTIRTLKLISYQITDADQLKNIKGFGAKTRNKISEILKNGFLQKVLSLSNKPQIQVMNQICQIYGFGSKIASDLYKLGVRGIKDLKVFAENHKEYFTDIQLAALEISDDLFQRIPREEVAILGKIIRDQLIMIEPKADMTVTGSYRRGRELCGDIDIVIGTKHKDKLLAFLITSLKAIGLMTHIFMNSHEKFTGVVKLEDKPHRQLDLYVCNLDETPYAVLYFTGSKNYNRLLRLEADKKGYHLSNTGLYNRSTGQKLINASCENDIIRFLGFPVLSLKERDV